MSALIPHLAGRMATRTNTRQVQDPARPENSNWDTTTDQLLASLGSPGIPFRSTHARRRHNVSNSSENQEARLFLARESAAVPPLVQNSAVVPAGAIRSEHERGASFLSLGRGDLTNSSSADHLDRLYLIKTRAGRGSRTPKITSPTGMLRVR